MYKKVLISTILIFAFSFLFSAKSAFAKILFYENWQSNKIDLNDWKITKDFPGMKIVNTPHRLKSDSDKAILFEFSYNDWVNCKSVAKDKGLVYGLDANWFNCNDPATEIRMSAGELSNFSWNKEYWYGWSVYFPSGNFEDVPVNFTQWHAQSGSTCCGPDLAFRVQGEGYVDIISRTDNQKNWSKQLFRPKSGEWYDFVLNAKLTPDKSGFIKLWVYSNGEEVGSVLYNGSTAHTSPTPSTYVKFGEYIPTWRNTATAGAVKKVVIDEIRIGDSNSSRNEVMPGGGIPADPTPDPEPDPVPPTPDPDPTPEPDPIPLPDPDYNPVPGVVYPIVDGQEPTNWTGDIDMVAIYDRALTAEEVAQNYAMGSNLTDDELLNVEPGLLKRIWNSITGAFEYVWNSVTGVFN